MDISRKTKCFVVLTVLLSVIAVVSCNALSNGNTSGIDFYYIIGPDAVRSDLLELFRLLEKEEPGSEGEFAVTREIAGIFARLNDYDRLIHFLNARTLENPSNPYNGFYYLMIAYGYLQQGSGPIAALFFDLILNNYPDLIVNGESIHLVSLRHLINLNDDPQRQVWYYSELISRFPDQIDLGVAYFMLGQALERVGDWDGAIQAYTNFLPLASGRVIPGFKNAEQYARQQVDFSRSSKDWTFETLPALVRAIKAAIDANSPSRLMRYQAKVNFSVRSWQGTEIQNPRMASGLNLHQLMHNRIRYAPALDPSSTATEAFLRTTGWPHSMSTWYLYFRRIHFPQDPEIHGRWEWAGIFYGERF